MPPLLFALFLGTFAIGTTEFAVVGLLPDIAESLGVSISQTGLLVSVYALGVAVGGPAVVAITTSQSRKRTLLQLCAIFVVGHALAALAPDYGLLMGARVLAAVSHASFLGIAAMVAAESVPSERTARAVSLVWLGFSAASLVGVPGATAMGHALGWRAAFWMLAAIGVVAGLALQLWMPAAPRGEATSLGQETDAYAVSRRERKKVEMLFAHLKRILRLGRLRLRGPSGAKDEFLLAATAQNLRKLAKLIPFCAALHPARAVADEVRPARIVSINMWTDELLLRLVDRDRIASVTWLSQDGRNANMADVAATIPANHGLAEEVVSYHPDLVLAGVYTTRTTVQLLKGTGLKVVEFGVPKTIDGVRQQIRDVAKVIDEGARGEAHVAR